MPIVHPTTYAKRPVRRKKRPIFRLFVLLLVVGAVANCLRPLPQTIAILQLPKTSGPAVQPDISWPRTGQAAIGAAGYGVLATYGSQNPVATASVAKVITALCVLQKQPLVVGQTGPSYTVDTVDMAIYNNYVAQNGSVIPVKQGEELTEYQALEALMVPSANNIADSLVRWVFGSHEAYVSYATQYLARQGLVNTHVGSDASGFDPSTTSNATDLTRLGLLALQSPVLMRAANQKQVDLPVAGAVKNYNAALGTNGITGLKTGNSDADNGAFVFTASYRIGDKDLSLTGAIMNALSLDGALQASINLVASLQQGFAQTTVAKAGQVIGTVRAPWGATAPIVSTHPVELIRWKGTAVSETHQVNTGTYKGVVGSLKVTSGQAVATSTLQLGHDLAQPSLWWRLTRH